MESQDEATLVENIREWLKKENIHNVRDDREIILKFLEGCKNNVYKAKIKMRNFYKAHRTTPELFHNRDPLQKNLDDLFAQGVLFPLPARPGTFPTLLVVKPVVKPIARHSRSASMTEVCKAAVMSVDLLLELDDNLTKTGVNVIIDFSRVRIHHALQMTGGLVCKMVHLWQNCYPIRIRGIDFLNPPSCVDSFLKIFRNLIGEKLNQRLRTHGRQMSSLHEIVAPEFLPEEYGGTLGPEAVFIAEWRRKIQAYRQWFLDDETLKSRKTSGIKD